MTPNHFSPPFIEQSVRFSASSALAVVLLGLSLLSPTNASAQQSSGGDDVWAGVEEMVVSGSDANSILTDVANSNSVTAFSAEDLQAIGAADISDIANFTPNLEIVTAGSTTPTFFIRGIGLNDFNANAAGAVAIYTDDVPLNNPALQLGSLFDIETANVLRGPQGTGAYRNASAGAIKVYSKKPTGEFGANINAEFGNFNARDIEGAVEFPITDETLWARIAFRTVSREGTFKNQCAGAPRVADRVADEVYCGEEIIPSQFSAVDPGQPKWLNSRSNWSMRGVFLFQPDISGDVDMEFKLTVRGGRRDEPSFVGQSIGTSGTNRFIDPTITVATDLIDRSNDLRPSIFGIFGGQDLRGYTPPEIVNALANSRDGLLAACAPTCTVGQTFGSRFESARRVAQDLARDLDSDPHGGAIDHAGGTTNDTWGGALKATLEFGDTLELTSVTGYDRWQRRVDSDLDFTPNITFEFDTQDEGHQFYQELKLTGESFDGLDEVFGGPLEWTVGAFFLTETLDVEVENDFGFLSGVARGRRYKQDIRTIAGYVTTAWDFWDAFTLDTGFRFNYEKRQIDHLLFFASITDKTKDQFEGHEPTGTVRLTWRPTEESSVYMKYTHGWKSGTFNAAGNRDRDVTPAGAEKIDAFEIGLKGSYFDDRLNLVLSLFHYDYRDYQLFTSIVEAQRPPQFVILNASDVELFGSEVEVTYHPWEAGTIDVKFAWLEGEFLEYVQIQNRNRTLGAVTEIIPTEVDFSGNQLLNAPEYSVTLSLTQGIPLGRFGNLLVRYDGTWKAVTYFDASEGRGAPNRDLEFILPDDTLGQEAFWIHNLRLAYYSPDELIEVALFVRNIENKTYKTFAADLQEFQDTTLFFVGDPRTYGVSTSIRF